MMDLQLYEKRKMPRTILQWRRPQDAWYNAEIRVSNLVNSIITSQFTHCEKLPTLLELGLGSKYINPTDRFLIAVYDILNFNISKHLLIT